MKNTCRLLFLLTLLLCILCVPALSTAADTAPIPRLVDSLAGERTFVEHETITIRPSSTIAEALDWLESFLHEEVGYARAYLVDLLQLVPTAVQNGVPGAAAIEVTLEQYYETGAQIYTTLSEYQTKLTYNYERIDFLVNFIGEPSVSAAYRQTLEAEIQTLKQESQALLAALANDQVAAIQSIQTLQSNMLALNGTEEIRASAKVAVRGTAESLRNAEAPTFAANNDVDIQVLSTKEIGVMMVGKEQGVTVKMWRADDTSRSSMKTVTTDKDGVAIFWIADFKPNSNNEVEVAVEVTMDGMRTKEVERMKLEGAQGFWIKLEKDNGKPYFTMLCFNGKDMLSQSNEIYIAKGNDAVQNIHFRLDTKGQNCTVKLQQGSWYPTVHSTKDVAAGHTGIISMDNTWCRIFKPDTALDFILSYGKEKQTIRAKLMPRKAKFDEPQEHSAPPVFMLPDLSLKLPNSIPIVGGGTLTFPLPVEKLKIYGDLNGLLYIGLGKLVVPEATKWRSQDMQDRLNMQQKLKKGSIANQMLYSAKTAWKEANTRKTRLLGSTEADFSPYAYAMLQLEDRTNWAQGGAVAGIRITYSFEVTQTFYFGPVPGYIGFDMNAYVGVGAELAVGFKYPSFTNWRVTKGSGIHLDLGIGIGITAGAGIPKLAYVQLRGSFSTGVAILLSAKPEAKATVAVSLDLEVKLLFFSKSWNLAKWQHPETSSDLQAQLVQSAQDRLIYLDPMDLSQYMTIDELAASLTASNLPSTDGSVGIKPDRYLFHSTNFGAVDTNVKFIQTDKHYYAFVTAGVYRSTQLRTRLCWIDLDTAGNMSTNFGYLPDNFSDRSLDIFDYDFDVAYIKEGDTERIAFTVLSGTRNGIKALGPNATDEEREAEMQKARLQTKVYGGAFTIDATNGNLKFSDGFKMKVPMSSISYSMPRVTALRDSFTLDNNSGQNVKVYATHGFVVTHYKADNKTVSFSSTSNTFSTLDGTGLGFTNYKSLAHVDPQKFSIDDIALLDFAVKSNGKHHVPVVCILHGKNGNKDMVVTVLDSVTSSSEMDKFPHVYDSFNTISPIRITKSSTNYQDTTEGVFLLQTGASADKGKRTKVSSLWVDGARSNGMAPSDVKMVYRDYGMYIGADGLDTTTVFYGTGASANRQLYAYWPQSIENDGKGGKKCELRAVLVDLTEKLVSPSFSFLELNKVPLRAKVMSALSTSEKVRCYSLIASNLGSTFPPELIGLEFRYKTIASLESVVAQYPIIGVGDPMSLITTFKNEGDLVISKITLDLYNGSTRFAQVVVDAIRDKNTVLRYDTNGLLVNPNQYFGAFDVSQSVFRLPGIYDEINCEVVTTQEGPFNADGSLGPLVRAERTLEGFMPGHVRAYRIQLNSTPKEWHGKQTIRVEISKLNASFSMGGKAGEPNTVEYEVDVKKNEVTEISYDANANPTRTVIGDGMVGYGTPVDENGDEKDSVNVDLAYNDQSLDLWMEYFDEEPYAIISLNNYGDGTSLDSPAVLTSYIGGRAIYNHTFTQPLTALNGYMLRIPLYRLTGGNPYEKLEVRLSSVADDANFREFADVDNVAIVEARAYFEIIPPVSLVRYEGEDAAFDISVIGDTGPYTYQWYYRLPNSITPTKMEGETTTAIALTNVQLSDDGTAFWCYVYDRFGNGKASGEATLTVLLPEDPPQTGDGWPLEALLALVGGALVVFIGYTVIRRRRR